MRAQLTCKICMDAPVGIAFLPCGHMGMFYNYMYFWLPDFDVLLKLFALSAVVALLKLSLQQYVIKELYTIQEWKLCNETRQTVIYFFFEMD